MGEAAYAAHEDGGVSHEPLSTYQESFFVVIPGPVSDSYCPHVGALGSSPEFCSLGGSPRPSPWSLGLYLFLNFRLIVEWPRGDSLESSIWG